MTPIDHTTEADRLEQLAAENLAQGRADNARHLLAYADVLRERAAADYDPQEARPYGPTDLPCGHWVHLHHGDDRQGWDLFERTWHPCADELHENVDKDMGAAA